MPLQMKFVPFVPPQDKAKKNISKGTYAVNPPWHKVQQKLQMSAGGFTGNLNASSILAGARFLSNNTTSTGGPVSAGSVTINSQNMGSFDYVTTGSTTISSFSNTDWFTSTNDTHSSWIIVKGDLTINSGQTLIPSDRKLFTLIYVTGNLVVNGSISMTRRGANHSGTGTSGGYTAPVDIRIGTGTFTGVVNPLIPATGGAGGTTRSTSGTNSGTAGTNGGTGGGASGSKSSLGGTIGTAGAGAAGTCFCAGGAGGSVYNTGVGGPYTGGDAEANGGKGGDGGGQGAGNQVAIGGAGNPGGTGRYFSDLDSRTDGQSGLAGVLIVICEGSLSGSGSIVSTGTPGTSFGVNGSGGGGGSVNVLFGTNPASAVSVSASGSGNGGDGTARKLAIGSN
jgi:hypothetical protein